MDPHVLGFGAALAATGVAVLGRVHPAGEDSPLDALGEPCAETIVIVRDPADLEEHVTAWDELAAQAIEANPFYESWMLRPAVEAFGRAAETLSAPTACDPLPAAASGPLLDIDAREFAACFDRRPFTIGHRLSGYALFSLTRLIELSRSLPVENVEYNAGDIPVSMNPALTPRNGLTPDETIARIAECRSWLVLKYVERDPEYCRLLERLLAEVRPHAEALRPGMLDGQRFIFVASPGAVTPYHMDPEHNFLLQIRGSKDIRLFDPRDRGILSAEALERFYGGGHRNMPYREEYEKRALSYELAPGRGLHFPVTAPHYVRNGPEVSVSFSITFRTPDLESRARTYLLNAWLRRRGISPAPVGQHPRRDALKSLAWRASRRIARALRH